MRIARIAVIAVGSLALMTLTVVDTQSSATPTTIIVPSGTLQLKALLWRPEGAGSFPAVLFTHGSGPTDPAKAHTIGPVFARHGYVVLYLFRRGDGLSSDQAPSLRDLLNNAVASGGAEARERLLRDVLTPENVDDTLAGLTILRALPGVDARRVALAGHSFGGQLVLFAAQRDATVRAVIAFAAGAAAWEGSAELQQRLRAAATNIAVPVFLTHAANDYSTKPAQAMADERARAQKPYELKIYRAVGTSQAEGHDAVYRDIQAWEADVFRFLDQHLERSAP